MKIRIKGILVFVCVFLLTIPAAALDASLNGRWVSLQYGSLTFTQNGYSFTAVWTGTNAAGTISGRQAPFRFWSGASFDKCEDDSRGYGTLTLSDDGNTLSGTWANLSEIEPESGSFTAVRLSSISGLITQDAFPELEEPPNLQTMETALTLPDISSTTDASPQQVATGSQTSAVETPSTTEPPDELTLLPNNLPPEYVGPIIEVISDLEESVLKIFGVFDDDTGDETDTVPHSPVDTTLQEDVSLQDSSNFWDFFVDLWTSLWGQ